MNNNLNIRYHKLTDNQHYFTIKNKKDKDILQSNIYTRKHDATRGLQSLIKALEKNQYFTYFNKKRCYFAVVNKHGKTLAQSKLWKRKSDLTKTINTLQKATLWTEN